MLASAAVARALPLASGSSAQLTAARALTDETVLVLRRHLEPRLETHDDGIRLTTRAGVLDLEASAAPMLEMLLIGEPLTAGVLGLELARHLLRGGVVVAT